MDLKPGFRSMATLKLVVNVLVNFKPKRTASALHGFFAAAHLSCCNTELNDFDALCAKADTVISENLE